MMARLIGLLVLGGWAYQSIWGATWVYEDRLAMAHATGRPLTAWTWTLTPTPLAAHALSLGLWLLVMGLLVALAWRLGLRGIGLWTVAVVGLLHPMFVESVAYAASRAELLAAIGLLGACLLALSPWPWLAVVGLGLGMAAKESAAVGLLLVPMLLWWTRSRWRGWATAASGVALSLGVWHVGGLRAVLNLGDTNFVHTTEISGWWWGTQQLVAAQHWLGAWVWLRGIAPDLDVDAVPLIGQLVSAGVMGLLVVLAGIGWHQRLIAGLGLTWCLVALVPRLLVQTPQSYVNAHQMLVPLLGMLLIVAHGMQGWERHAQEGCTEWRK